MNPVAESCGSKLQRALHAIHAWMEDAALAQFPYDKVLAAYLGAGKHFVDTALLDALTLAREHVRTEPSRELIGAAELQTLTGFLDVALDKRDGSYGYVTYLGLPLLPLPGADKTALDARANCDRLTVQLIADALAFELAAADGRTEILPTLRPDSRTRQKRFRLGVNAVRLALKRLGEDVPVMAATQSEEAARVVCATVERCVLLDRERRTLSLTMMPVHIHHDEYLFIRTLQAYETAFVSVSAQLRAAILAVTTGKISTAVMYLGLAESLMQESAPLFSLLATMQVDSFRTFREYTVGSSAIQSRNYKVLESLCRNPSADRLDSVAYVSVPEVRECVAAGQLTLDGAYRQACADAAISVAEITRLSEGMAAFARVLERWRQTHYRLATYMMGEATGTGYTEGTPYLAAALDEPVFLSIDRTASVPSH